MFIDTTQLGQLASQRGLIRPVAAAQWIVNMLIKASVLYDSSRLGIGFDADMGKQRSKSICLHSLRSRAGPIDLPQAGQEGLVSY